MVIFFFADDYYGYDDAIYVAGRLLQLLSRTDKKLSELKAEIPKYYSTPEIRLEAESDELKLEKTNWDIIELINEVFETFEVKSEKKNIKLKLPKHQKPILVEADRNKISQVLYNLISNAIKYGQEFGEVRGQITNESNQILISIKDNGYGIEKNSIKRVFERFYRSSKARAHTKGTGLGLALVKQLSSRIGANVKVESQINVGSEFFVSFQDK